MIGLALLLLTQAVAGAGEIRAVQVSITDKQGRPVDGLMAEEVAILENGVARDLASIQRDLSSRTPVPGPECHPC